MLRSDLIIGLKKIFSALEKTKITSINRAILRGGEKKDESSISTIMKSYEEVSAVIRSMGSQEIELLDALGISFISQIQYWSDLISVTSTGTSRPSTELNQRYIHLVHLTNSAKYIIDALERSSPKILNFADDDVDALSGRLTVIFVESEGKETLVGSIATMMGAVEVIYNIIENLDHKSNHPLVLKSCDSGSDKQFNITGRPGTIKQIGTLFAQTFYNLIFYKETKLKKNLELASMQLDLIEKVEKMQKNKAISQNDGEVVKSKIIKNVNGFFESGALTDELRKEKEKTIESLVKPAPQLLLEAPSSGSKRQKVEKTTKNERIIPKHTSEPDTDDFEENTEGKE